MQDYLLVTGGAGFIGINFILDWLAHHPDSYIINVDKLSYAANQYGLSLLAQQTHHIFVQADINDSACMRSLLAKYQPRAVVHFAAESHVDRSIAGAEDFISSNIVGTYRLLEAVRAYWQTLPQQDAVNFRFLHVSTDEVYGALQNTDAPFTETSTYAPNSPYSASKASSDHLVRAWFHTYGLPVLSTHCSNNFGAFQHPEKLIPLAISRALAGQKIPMYGTGQNVRDWLHVSEHCAALRVVLAQGKVGESYNIGANNEQTNLNVVHRICDILDELKPRIDGVSYRQQISFVADRAGHDWRYAIDASKIRRELAWQAQQDFDSTLRQTIIWYLR